MLNHTLFVGDLHLSADRPDILAAFYAFLELHANHCDALYILGDLFEVWVGDDLAEPFALELAATLKRFAAHTPIYFIHGNRDFLLGKEYAALAGMILLPEVHCIDLYGQTAVLLHGDNLCTLDKAYQRFRWFRNQSWVKFIYGLLPQKRRVDIASGLRNKSQQSNQQKSDTIMDVENHAVTELMDKTGASLMIHGHTHRPNVHSLAGNRQRIVVGDWYDQGSVLTVTPTEATLSCLPLK